VEGVTICLCLERAPARVRPTGGASCVRSCESSRRPFSASGVSAKTCLISTILCFKAYGNSSFPTMCPHAPSFGVSSLLASPAPFRTHALHLSSTSSFSIYSASPSSSFHDTLPTIPLACTSLYLRPFLSYSRADLLLHLARRFDVHLPSISLPPSILSLPLLSSLLTHVFLNPPSSISPSLDPPPLCLHLLLLTY
jgi:hypothetical protein